ncbi:hypothetical protein ACRARG_17215 [Pseudooceanicola sp. C21-150M6]|uniref:hypothetical protein n=1 Tax=Pseudooceanicola sp. C21-150M6 TaxID=3434355 RepID=UPI003D7FDB65
MQLVVTTPIAFLVFFAILYVGPVRGVVLFFATMPFNSSAAFNLSGLGTVSLTDFGIVALFLALLLHGFTLSQIFSTLKPGQPGFSLLILVIVIAIGAVFLPRINAGNTEVFVLARRGDQGAIFLAPLTPVGGNIAQVIRMILSGGAFVALAAAFRRYPDANMVLKGMTAATLIHLLFSIADLLSPYIGGNPFAFLRTGLVMILDSQVLLGVRRLIAGFPEPSAFSYYTVGLYGFWLRYWFGATKSPASTIFALLMGLLLIRSTSSAAYVALTAFTFLFLAWQLRTVAKSRRSVMLYSVMTLAIPAMFGAMVLLYSLVPAVSEMLDRIVFTKLNSHSGEERMSWNTQALTNMVETSGLGAGIGSVRASSWIFVCLGSLGLLGTGIYLWFIGKVLLARPPSAMKATRTAEVVAALQAGCVAILIQACLTKPYPNLETPFFAMAGLVAGLWYAMRAAQRSHAPVPPAPPVRIAGTAPVFRS